MEHRTPPQDVKTDLGIILTPVDRDHLEKKLGVLLYVTRGYIGHTFAPGEPISLAEILQSVPQGWSPL